ncbi:c-type cytochrome [Pseudorhodoferax sp.]|uniref:c-type cytochrome n=1 Tax=Pseudorhodoferax sp. TaxID=1993553 RepID=UPI002DD66506|nr:c-type cytochrome [Pseudorhodoferax sp.]
MKHAGRLRRTVLLLGLLCLLGVAVAASAGWWGRAADLRLPAASTLPAPDAAAAARGAYLAQVGHCAGCHTAPGGPPYGGGRGLNTPFGAVFAANLTPDAEHGLGRWGPDAFRRALKDGRSADGRALLPACPYSNFSLVDDADADDLFAFLRSLAPQPQPVPAHRLDWPYGLPVALAAWRLRHHRAATLPPVPAGAGAGWARGAYLVGGLAHCSACHGQRDGWGATDGAWDFRGGEIPMQGWLAPSLLDPAEAGLAGWREEEVVALLTAGRNRHATVSGPMAVVVAHSTQHLNEADARAMAEFLRHLPAPGKASPRRPVATPAADVLQSGEQLYAGHCAECHGKQGEGAADSGPALQGNRALALASPVNVIRMVLGGGFGPSTAAEPMPPGMPPYATLLSDEQIAAVVTHLRWQYGARASAVTAFEVNRQRGGALR